MTAVQLPRRRRLPRIRLSVRSVMLLVLALACWLGWYLQRVRSQQDAFAAIVKAGGSLEYDWRLGHFFPDIIDYPGKPQLPKWLSTRVGEDYFADITYVSLIPRPKLGTETANDDTLRRLSRLNRLEYLGLFSTAVTDAGLAHVRQLTRLKQLDLRKTQIGDPGIAHLKGMTNLRVLDIAETRVTDEGALAIEESLPEVQVLRDEDILSPRLALRAAADFDFARSQPVRLACRLLVHHARVLASHRDSPQLSATVHALCDLEATDKYSLLKLAQARAECLGILEPKWTPTLTASEREALEHRCGERHRRVVARRRSGLHQSRTDRRQSRSDANTLEPSQSRGFCRDRCTSQSETRSALTIQIQSRSAHRASIFGKSGAGLPPVIGAVTFSAPGNCGVAASA